MMPQQRMNSLDCYWAQKRLWRLFITDEENLPAPVLIADAKLGFDPFKKELTYAGVLSASARTVLENAADSLVLGDMDIITIQPDLDTFIADFKTALGLISTGSNNELTTFGDSQPELKTIYDSVIPETTPSAQSQN
ncbi:MAG: hypothetical protein IPP25_07895 [Saprospiraceae bacterium]|nr:hypothetical protein [Candidatus Opimibacter skivensis]